MRLRLLGEDLIAFRVSSGQVGVIQNHCPHRGAQLFFGRNEEEGLRCVYHGWKFDVDGACVDMPNEPAESDFKTKVKAIAYRAQERGGVVWAYMGPNQAAPPPLPDLEANMLPEGQYSLGIFQRECNYMQALEGDIDTGHTVFLHTGHLTIKDAPSGSWGYAALADRAPHYRAVDTNVGTMYTAYRPVDDIYYRIAQFLSPFYTMIPTGVLGLEVRVRRLGADRRRPHLRPGHAQGGQRGYAGRRRVHSVTRLGCCRTPPNGWVASGPKRTRATTSRSTATSNAGWRAIPGCRASRWRTRRSPRAWAKSMTAPRSTWVPATR